MPALSALTLRQFRSFSFVEFSPGPAVNFLLGDNGSGKTSILEALYFVCRGRSFRAVKTEEIVRHGDPTAVAESIWRAAVGSFVVRGVLQRTGAGQLALQGKRVRKSAELLRRIPLIFIASHNLDLVGCPPARRRAFLNGLLLHLVPEFAQILRDYRHCLSERNSRLAHQPPNYEAMAPWDRTLADLGERVEAHRSRFVAKLIQGASELLTSWGGPAVSIAYQRGWPAETSLAQALAAAFPQDLRHGFSTRGCHRADLHLHCASYRAAHRLSLGQSNMVALAFFGGAHQLLTDRLQTEVPLVLDDVIQRFDKSNLKLLGEFFHRRSTQVLVTATDYPTHWPGLDTDRQWRVAEGAIHAT